MSGNTLNELELPFLLQIEFQKKVTGLALPADHVQWFMYHSAGMTEELGEVLKADKRWKTHRNEHFDPENKVEELADVFITAINLAIFSGISPERMLHAIVDKIKSNTDKLNKIRGESNETI